MIQWTSPLFLLNVRISVYAYDVHDTQIHNYIDRFIINATAVGKIKFIY